MTRPSVVFITNVGPFKDPVSPQSTRGIGDGPPARDIPFDEEVAPADEALREEQGDRGFTIDTDERRRKFAEDFDQRVDEDRQRRARR